jgi:hypothetical protein
MTTSSNVTLYVSIAITNALGGTLNYATAGPYVTSVPGAPSAITSVTMTTANLTNAAWTAPSGNGTDTAAYIVWAGSNTAGGDGTYGKWTGLSSGFNANKALTSYTAGTSIYLTVWASNSKGQSASFAYNGPYGVPIAPASASLSITNLTTWSITFTGPTSGIAPTSYIWYLSKTATDTSGANLVTSGSTTTSPVNGSTTLTYGTNYYAIVRSVRPEASSGITASSPANYVSLVAPTNLQFAALPVTLETTTTLTLSWSTVTNATSYDVYVDDVSNSNVATTSINVTISTAGRNSFHKYRVYAKSTTTGPASQYAYAAVFTSNSSLTFAESRKWRFRSLVVVVVVVVMDL